MDKPWYKIQIVTPDGIQCVECSSTNKVDIKEFYKKYAHEAGSVMLFKEIPDDNVAEELEL